MATGEEARTRAEAEAAWEAERLAQLAASDAERDTFYDDSRRGIAARETPPAEGAPLAGTMGAAVQRFIRRHWGPEHHVRYLGKGEVLRVDRPTRTCRVALAEDRLLPSGAAGGRVVHYGSGTVQVGRTYDVLAAYRLQPVPADLLRGPEPADHYWIHSPGGTVPWLYLETGAVFAPRYYRLPLPPAPDPEFAWPAESLQLLVQQPFTNTAPWRYGGIGYADGTLLLVAQTAGTVTRQPRYGVPDDEVATTVGGLSHDGFAVNSGQTPESAAHDELVGILSSAQVVPAPGSGGWPAHTQGRFQLARWTDSGDWRAAPASPTFYSLRDPIFVDPTNGSQASRLAMNPARILDAVSYTSDLPNAQPDDAIRLWAVAQTTDDPFAGADVFSTDQLIPLGERFLNSPIRLRLFVQRGSQAVTEIVAGVPAGWCATAYVRYAGGGLVRAYAQVYTQHSAYQPTLGGFRTTIETGMRLYRGDGGLEGGWTWTQLSAVNDLWAVDNTGTILLGNTAIDASPTRPAIVVNGAYTNLNERVQPPSWRLSHDAGVTWQALPSVAGVLGTRFIRRQAIMGIPE